MKEITEYEVCSSYEMRQIYIIYGLCPDCGGQKTVGRKDLYGTPYRMKCMKCNGSGKYDQK